MEENESDDNPSAFPLFNFAALKQSFSNVPLDITSSHQPSLNTANLSSFASAKVEDPKDQKKPRSRGSRKKKTEGEEAKVTIKDILEDLQTGIPMESDLKMKEEKLKKMKEGRARKKNKANKDEEEKQNNTTANKANKTKKQESQILNNLAPQFQDTETPFPESRIVIKDGKPVLEMAPDFLSSQDPMFNSLLTVQKDKPNKLTSMSFRKKAHTKQWSEEETKKFYKALELFGSDFSMITKLFPTRDRAQIKNKLHKEEKENPNKVENAFRQHERSSKKSLMTHLGDITRKQVKGEPEQLPPTTQLERLNSINIDKRNRTFSNCSLDSVDKVIFEDLKGLVSKEIHGKKNEGYGLNGTFALEGFEDKTKENSKSQDSTLLENLKKENGNVDQMSPDIPIVKKEEAKFAPSKMNQNNLLFSLLSK